MRGARAASSDWSARVRVTRRAGWGRISKPARRLGSSVGRVPEARVRGPQGSLEKENWSSKPS